MATKKETAVQAADTVVKTEEAPMHDAVQEQKPKMVKIRLFSDNGRYKGDLFVSVNGVNYKIQRGVDVEVPEAVAEVLRHSQEQDSCTAARIVQLESAN